MGVDHGCCQKHQYLLMIKDKKNSDIAIWAVPQHLSWWIEDRLMLHWLCSMLAAQYLHHNKDITSLLFINVNLTCMWQFSSVRLWSFILVLKPQGQSAACFYEYTGNSLMWIIFALLTVLSSAVLSICVHFPLHVCGPAAVSFELRTAMLWPHILYSTSSTYSTLIFPPFPIWQMKVSVWSFGTANSHNTPWGQPSFWALGPQRVHVPASRQTAKYHHPQPISRPPEQGGSTEVHLPCRKNVIRYVRTSSQFIKQQTRIDIKVIIL